MGTIDRLLRTAAAVLVAILFLTRQITGVFSVILGLLALIFILTSLAGTCPLYIPFKFSTIRKNKKTDQDE